MTGFFSLRSALAAVVPVIVLGCSNMPSAPLFDGSASFDVSLMADQRLSDADAAIEKAILLVLNAQNPSAPRPTRPFGGHDEKAIRHLEAAREEIAKAQAFADASIP